MKLFPNISWKEISSDTEPKSLKEKFECLFNTQNDDLIDLHIYLNNLEPCYYFCNELTSIPLTDRDDHPYELLLYVFFIGTLLTLNTNYKDARKLLDWARIDKFLSLEKPKELNSMTLYATVLYYFLKSQQSVLSEAELKLYTNITFEELDESVHFQIEYQIFHADLGVNMPLAEFFGWNFTIVHIYANEIASLTGLLTSDVVESYLLNYFEVTSLLNIGESKILSESLDKLFENHTNSLLKRTEQFYREGEHFLPSKFKNYIREIKKKTLEEHENLLTLLLNKLMDSVLINDSTDGNNIFIFLKEIQKKKYLIPLLDLNSDRVDNLLSLLNNADKSSSLIGLDIFDNWIQQEVKVELLQSSFQLAYLLAENRRINESVQIYESILKKVPNNVSTLNNLAVLYSNELNEHSKAIELLEKGKSISPEHENINNNLEIFINRLEEQKNRPKIMKERYFKQTDKIHKKILFAIYKLSTQEKVSGELLQRTTNLPGYRFFIKHINELINLELISFNEEEGYILDPTIYIEVENYINPKVEREVVRASKNALYRPIFYHESEIKLYQALIELFPQQLVFPNMDLKSIIDVDKIKTLLEQDIVEYMFKAHVDYAIISNTTYLPILCIEKDSTYQDDGSGARNAIKKNIIFSTSGLSLLRIRFSSSMDFDRLREEVKQATKEFLLQAKQGDDKRGIINEFDLKRFGIYDELPMLEEVTAFWSESVGELIKDETQNIQLDLETAILNITVSKRVESILGYGKDAIKNTMYEEFPSLNSIQFYYI